MSRKRTFTVHVNIDDMTAMLAGLDGPSEKSDWLDGYMVGVHGHPSRETWSQPKRMGYDFGAKHFAEVEEFRAEQKRKSDLAEAAKNAQKNPEGTHGVPTGTGSGNPAGDPIQQSNNPLIQQPKEPENQRSRFVPPTLDELIAYAKEVGLSDPQRWMDHYVSNGWKVGKSKMVDWKACVRNWARSSNQPKPQAQKPEWVIKRIEELRAKLATAERQYRRDSNERGAESQTAKLSKIEMDRIKKEIDAL